MHLYGGVGLIKDSVISVPHSIFEKDLQTNKFGAKKKIKNVKKNLKKKKKLKSRGGF